MKNIVKTAAVLIVLILASTSAFAEYIPQGVGVKDRIISKAIKGLAKAYVATKDVPSLEAKVLNKLHRMDEARFQELYARAYSYAMSHDYGLTGAALSYVRDAHGIDAYMTKAQAIRCIERFDRRAIYEIIDSVPDDIVVNVFRQYLSRRNESVRTYDLEGQIRSCALEVKADIESII